MQPGIFEFQSMLTSVVNGINGSLLASIQSVAYVLMTICLVLGIYEAYVRGGDVRSLAGTFLKYAVAAFVIGYWPNFFSDLFTGFNQIANTIDSSFGVHDLLTDWESQLQVLFQIRRISGYFQGNSMDSISPAYTFGDHACLRHLSSRSSNLCADLYILGVMPLCDGTIRDRSGAEFDDQLAYKVLRVESWRMECLVNHLRGFWLSYNRYSR